MDSPRGRLAPKRRPNKRPRLGTRYERKVDMKKVDKEPRTFQTLLIKKFRLEQLETNAEDEEGMRSEQANKGDIKMLKKEIQHLEERLRKEAEEDSDDGEAEDAPP